MKNKFKKLFCFIMGCLFTYCFILKCIPTVVSPEKFPVLYQKTMYKCLEKATTQRETFYNEISPFISIKKASSEYEKIKQISSWVSSLFSHNGENEDILATPLAIFHAAKKDISMRCVEYSILMAGTLQAFNLVARVTGLKKQHADTIKSGAGHVVCEVFSYQFNKWIMVDGQWNIIVEHNGIPLNAWEISQMLKNNQSLNTIDATTGKNLSKNNGYLHWLAPYLCYFDTAYNDYDQFSELLPATQAKMQLHAPHFPDLTVFQYLIQLPIACFVTEPELFYPQIGR